MEVMDSGNYSTESPHLGPLLYRQFEEQSSLCDAIVRTGSWEKRYHWCVLVASPFFDNIHRNNFLEKQTGLVDLNKWPASVLEMALLFLYGTPPVVTEANSDMLMDIAEFLLIPELKRICIEYLKETKVTLDNCMQLYELSSMYGFSLEECENFIKGKLPEVLEQERMLNTTSDSLKLLLADPTLSYVSVKTWFQFLVRWAHKTPERQAMFVELLSLLDFNSFDRDFLDNTVAKEPLVMNADEDVMERLMSVQNDSNDTIVILGVMGQYNVPKYFNMRTKLWYQICLSMDSDSEDYSKFERCRIAGVKSSSCSCIYKLDRRRRCVRVLTYDLNNAQYQIQSVDTPISSGSDHQADGDADNRGDDDYYDLIFRRFSTETGTLTAVSMTPSNTTPELCPSDDPDPISRMFKNHDKKQYRSTLHIIKLDEPVPTLRTVLTFKDYEVSAQARSNNGTVAMLTEDKEKLFLYNDSTCELECIRLNDLEIELGCLGDVAAFKDDFYLYDDYSVIFILRLSGASLEKKYLVKQLAWTSDNDGSNDVRYSFDGDRWFRLSMQRAGFVVQDLTIKYVSHNDLLKTENTASLCWEEIPIPPEARIRHTFELGLFSVSLAKGTGQCHLNCPHCKMIRPDQDLLEDDDDEEEEDDDELGDDEEELYSPDNDSSIDDHDNDNDNNYIYDSDDYDPFIF